MKEKKKKARPASAEEKRRAVEEAAYHLWMKRGGEHGRDLDDWLEAEEEIAQNIFEYDPEE
jgi:hypothetical protein